MNSPKVLSGAKERIAVIGGGIVGLAHAWSAASRGKQVLLFERHPRAIGASIRNFGMVWPIGQPLGALYDAAVRSRHRWQQLFRKAGIWHSPCGSLHLAYQQDELQVLQEFCQLSIAAGADCAIVEPAEVIRRSPAVKANGLLGALWSPTEMCVDPREVIMSMPIWLRDTYGVELHYDSSVVHVSLPWVVTSSGDRFRVDGAVVAAGADFKALYPELYQQAGFQLCKLQMMRTGEQPRAWRIGPMIAGGLTLRHYAAFEECRSLPALKKRVHRDTPELDKFGIHVMASQNGNGEVVLGDSHEYGDCLPPFDKSRIDDLMLRELQRMIDLPNWTIAERWHGLYPKAPNTLQFTAEPEPNVHIVIASGGCGMTMSFGLAEDSWSKWHGKPIEKVEESLV